MSDQLTNYNTDPKTIREWFAQAKALDLPWADSAIAQAEDGFLDLNVNFLSSAVWLFAAWDKTKEGRAYWLGIRKALMSTNL